MMAPCMETFPGWKNRRYFEQRIRVTRSFFYQINFSVFLPQVCFHWSSYIENNLFPSRIFRSCVHAKLLRDYLKVFFLAAATIFTPYATHSMGDIYLRVSLNAAFISMYFPNQPTTHMKDPQELAANLRKVSAWKFNMRYRNRVSSTTNKLRFYCFVPNIWLAGFENRPFDWLDLKMLESIVSVLSSDCMVFIVCMAPVSVNAL